MSIRANLSGKPLLCAAQAARDLAQRGYPVPQEFGRANSFLCPRGRQPGRGWLLLKRQDAEAFDKAARHTLTFHDGTRAVELQGLVYVTSRCLTVGSVNRDPAGAHLVEVADERWLAANPLYQHGLNQQYNVVAPDYRAATDADRWLSDTLDGTDPWTWRTMLSDLWGRLPSAAVAAPCPDLALVPDDGEPYVPHNWRFVGQSVWEAIHDILEHLSLALVLDPLQAPDAAGRFRVVDPGTADAALDELHTEAATAKALIYDRAAVDSPAARLPATVRVHFPAPPRHHGGGRDTGSDGGQWQGAPAYTSDIANPYGNGQADVVHPVWSDFEVHTLADGSRQSGADYGGTGAADVWAATLAQGYCRTLHAGGSPLMQRTYLGAWSFTPGSMAGGVAWRQADWTRQGAVLTEIVRGPGQAVRVGDEGRFEGLDPSRPAQPPALGWGFPAYPPHVQAVGSGSGAGSGALQDGTLYQYDADADSFVAREQVWRRPLDAGQELGRLAGYAAGRPVYLAGPGGAGLTVKEVDDTPSVTPVTVVRLDQTDGLTVTPDGGTQVTITILDASTTQDGIVNTTTQTIGGDKTFECDTLTLKDSDADTGSPLLYLQSSDGRATSAEIQYIKGGGSFTGDSGLGSTLAFRLLLDSTVCGSFGVTFNDNRTISWVKTHGTATTAHFSVINLTTLGAEVVKTGIYTTRTVQGAGVDAGLRITWEFAGGILVSETVDAGPSGSGSGAVSLGCCPDVTLPDTLTLTLPDASTDTLTYNEGNSWIGTTGAVLGCWDIGDGLGWYLQANETTIPADEGGTCDPFDQTFTDGTDVYEVTE